MVKTPRNRQWRKTVVLHVIDDDHDQERSRDPIGSVYCQNSRSKSKLLYFLFLSWLSCCLILVPLWLSSSTTSTFSILNFADSLRFKDDQSPVSGVDAFNAPLYSAVPNGTMWCDRNSIRSDICTMKGDVRTHSVSSSVSLYIDSGFSDYISPLSEDDHGNVILRHEKINPYTRKWETSVMTNYVAELDLFVKKGNSNASTNRHKCDVNHEVPAVFFSTGGYTGNAYHDINDGILPLYITSQHFDKKVVFVILDFHNWWVTKYADVLSTLSDYPVINFRGENITHCFTEAIVGLRAHDELAIDPSMMQGKKTIVDFRNVLDRAYWPRIKSLTDSEEVKMSKKKHNLKKPKLSIISRTGSREITNEKSLVKMCEEIGFSVTVLSPNRTTELAKLYKELNSSDVLVGVHGAAMTYFLFMKPGSVFIQIIPLGTDWPSENYYGEPSIKLGLKYVGYKILPKESSLYDEHDKDDPVLTDPDRATGKNWELTKKIYLDHQNVRLNLPRFRRRLVRAYYHTINAKKKEGAFSS